MRDILTVFSYTFYENLRKKAFIISTIIILILTVIILNVPAVVNLINDKTKTTVNIIDKNGNANKPVEKIGTVYVIDTKGFLKNDIDKAREIYKQYNFEFITQDKFEAIKEQVKTGKDLSLIELTDNGGVPYMNYWVKQMGKGLSPDDLSKTIKNLYSNRLLKTANVPDSVSTVVLSDVNYNIKELGKGMVNSYIASILITMLMFFAVYFFGYGIAMSVASEKTSRIMEIMLTSTKPSKMIIGKTAAMGLLGLCQFLALVLIAALSYKLTFPKDFLLFGQSINFSSFTPFSIVMIFIYFILGYSLYAFMNAVAGATVSKAEDLQSAMMPISLITVASFYLAYGSFMSPDGPVSMAASIIPFSAAFSMPSRIIATDVPVWQILISLAALIITIVIIAWTSIKLYSRAVLHYGKRLKLNDIIKVQQ